MEASLASGYHLSLSPRELVIRPAAHTGKRETGRRKEGSRFNSSVLRVGAELVTYLPRDVRVREVGSRFGRERPSEKRKARAGLTQLPSTLPGCLPFYLPTTSRSLPSANVNAQPHPSIIPVETPDNLSRHLPVYRSSQGTFLH